MSIILIVDDERPFLNFIQRLFKNIGEHTVISAINIECALKSISDGHPDIVLADIHLDDKGKNGVDFVLQARTNGYKGVICMLTGDSSPILLLQSALAGADDYIVKGPSCDLPSEVERLLENRDFGLHENPIADSAFLRSKGIRDSQADLLAKFSSLGYPRLKELANQIDLPEHSLWKRLSRIRDKLDMDGMSQVTHLLTAISIFGEYRKNYHEKKETTSNK